MRWYFRVLQLLITNIKGVYHLVDISDRLPALIRAPGLSRWKVTAEKDINMQNSYEEYLSTLSEQQKAASKVVSTMFPPANEGTLHLERWFVNVDYGSSMEITDEITPYSWRIYPHQQNTGGFFVAVLERVPKPKPSGTKRPKEDEEEDRQAKKPKLEEAAVHPPLGPIASARVVVAPAGGQMDVDHVETEENGDDVEKELKARPSGSYKEEPYTFLDPENEDLKSCL